MIEKISSEEFYAVRQSLGRESEAIRSLKPGEAIKFPCRWKHSKIHSCSGTSMAHYAATRVNSHISFRCYQGNCYVLRLEEGGAVT